MRVPLIDLHSHVLPGVDDGAADTASALLALHALEEQGVERVIATPHFRASLLERSGRANERLELFDDAYAELISAMDGAGLAITVGRGCEFKLDAPIADLDDPRLRLGGTRYALVEFGAFQLPPFAGNQLKAVRDAGWVPVLAHPERYFGMEHAMDRVARWVSEGTLLQVNAGSLAGGYGPAAREVAVDLLARGWVCCIAGDYHARGEPDWPAALELLRTSSPIGSEGSAADGGGSAARTTVEWIRQLVHENPSRMLRDDEPGDVAPRAIGLGSRAGGWLRR